MTKGGPSLETLRREIDAVDDRMHDLLMHRAEIVEHIGAVKVRNDEKVYIRPGREALILRRLVGRHRGSIPAAVVVRMWREMIAATARLQGPLSVAVHAPEKSVGYWDLARDHYGSGTRMTLHRVATLVIRAVVDGTATIGVLPLPEDEDADPWWRMLLATDARMPRVVARLPFIENRGGRLEHLEALAIGPGKREPTGDDVTLLAVEASAELSRGRLIEGFRETGLTAHVIAVWHDREAPDSRLYLLELRDFVAADDARIARVEAGLGGLVGRSINLGGYAVPLGDVGGGDGA